LSWWQATTMDEALDHICASPDKEKALEHDLSCLLSDLPTESDWRLIETCRSKWKILEIGCGVGRLMKPLCLLFEDVWGVDTSESYLHFALDYLWNTSAHLLLTDGKTLPLDDNQFDFVYSFLVFQHIRSVKIFKSYLSEVYRVLKPNGIFRFQLHDTSDPKFGRWEEDLATVWGNVYTAQELYDLMLEFKYQNIVIKEQSPWIWVTVNK
jgi:ubiquinone/menaquinone biosynthesis C-methylase UbiE